jgi:hypothetical protein
MYPCRNWDSPNPSLARMGGAHSPAGESQFRRLEKKLSTLPTLWVQAMQTKDNVAHRRQ